MNKSVCRQYVCIFQVFWYIVRYYTNVLTEVQRYNTVVKPGTDPNSIYICSGFFLFNLQRTNCFVSYTLISCVSYSKKYVTIIHFICNSQDKINNWALVLYSYIYTYAIISVRCFECLTMISKSFVVNFTA